MPVLTMLGDATAAMRQILTPPFRRALLSILAITLAVLAVAGVGLHALLGRLATPSYPWLAVIVSVAEGLGLALAAVFLVAPVSALVAGFFVDDLAEHVERTLEPPGPAGRPLPIGRAVLLSVRFAVLSLVVILLALGLLLVPGINGIAFLAANAYLAGRQYFEFAALRFRSDAEVVALRRAHPGAVYGAGFCIALMLAVPLLNLLTPLFGTALMVRVHRRLAAMPA